MSSAEQKHYLICKLKELANTLNRVPMMHEFAIMLPRVDILGIFGTWDGFLMAAGIHVLQNEKPPKFKYKKSLIESFNVIEMDLDEIFEKCGNPETIKVIAQPDTHVAHRDLKAVDVFLKFLEWYSPDVHIIMGDFLDAEGVSHWESDDLKPREFIPEVIEARELLQRIVDLTPKTKVRTYLTGNHEDWLRQAMAHKLPSLFNGLKELGLMPDIEALLDLKKFGYDLIDLNNILKIGKAHFTHGLYVGANHPKKHLDTIKGNIYYGHLHDTLAFHTPSIHGMIEAASLGCLARLDAKFLKGKPNNWLHGFGIFEFFKDGSYSFYQVKIFNGKFSYNGKVFSA